MTDHIVKAYDVELLALDKKIAQMGGLAEHMLGTAFDALERRDPALAEQAISADRGLDQIQAEIEEHVVGLIARRQPMANDLRRIMSTMKVAGELERTGDLAKNIAKRSLVLSSEPYPKPLVSGLRHMVELAQAQLKDVLDAYAERSVEGALAVWQDDQNIDATYNSVFRELLTYMMEDPRNIGLCTHLLFAAKNIERIGDHATNIAETIHFLVTGTPILSDRPKSDQTSSTLIKN